MKVLFLLIVLKMPCYIYYIAQQILQHNVLNEKQKKNYNKYRVLLLKHIIKVLYENNKLNQYFNSKPFIKHIKIYLSENNSFAFTESLSFNPVKY